MPCRIESGIIGVCPCRELRFGPARLRPDPCGSSRLDWAHQPV